MITALVSNLLGFVGGVLPNILEELKASREHTREMERMKFDLESKQALLKAGLDVKLAEIDAESFRDQMRSLGDQMRSIYETQKPIGIPWIDGFNALIRPLACSMIITMFCVTAVMYFLAILTQFGNGLVDLDQAAKLIWNSLLGEAIQGVLGYLFGYRSAVKRG